MKRSYKNHSFIYDADLMDEEISFQKLIDDYDIELETLQKICIRANQAHISELEWLTLAPNLTTIAIYNSEIDTLDWLKTHTLLNSLTLSSVIGQTDDFYQPIKQLHQLRYLDISFSKFSEHDIFLTKNTTLFDCMKNLSYLNLRETSIKRNEFLNYLDGRTILLNYQDNACPLDFSKHPTICLVTLTKLLTGELMDITKYLGS